MARIYDATRNEDVRHPRARQMSANDLSNVHFLHIGKTGGTAVKYALTRADTGPLLHLHLHNHGMRLVDIPKGELVVFFLRDPITRFVSWFLSRQRQGKPRYNFPWSEAEARAFSRFQTANELGVALSSDDRGLRNAAAAAMNGIQHVRDSFWRWLGTEDELLRRKSDLLFIGQQEYLTDDAAVMATRLKIGALKLPSDEVESHRNPGHLNRSPESQAIANLRQWYNADYEALCFASKLHGSLDSVDP